ncbi:MAG: multidrug resistance efflux pump [Bacteroidia bacterium]|jgi:multidrug resistance efflux pump
MSDSKDADNSAGQGTGNTNDVASTSANEQAADGSGKGDEMKEAQTAVSKARLGIIGFIALSLVWYLLADRFTPYTTQARIEGYIVGVAPKVAGLVTEVWVTNNTRVEQGQKLFQIDPSQYEIALSKARSDLETARRQVDAGSSVVDAARANLAAAQANEVKAKKDYTRLKNLREEDSGSISVRRVEVSRASYEQAQAGVASAAAGIQQAIEQMGGQDESDNAILKTALAAVAKAELDLANTTVISSLPGTITDLRTDVGQYAGTGSPVLTLISMHDVWVAAEFTENNLGNLDIGSPVEILFDALPGQVFPGRVRSIGLGISAKQAAPAGTLPTISNNRDWLRQSQRFPVVVEFSPADSKALRQQIRIGGQAAVMAYSEGHGILKLIGKAYIRVMSFFSYAY